MSAGDGKSEALKAEDVVMEKHCEDRYRYDDRRHDKAVYVPRTPPRRQAGGYRATKGNAGEEAGTDGERATVPAR